MTAKNLQEGTKVRILPAAFRHVHGDVPASGAEGTVLSVEELGGEPTGAYSVEYTLGPGDKVLQEGRFWEHHLTV